MQAAPQVVPATEAPIVRVEMKSKLGLDGPKPTPPHVRRPAPVVGEVPAGASRARRRRKS
jgi:hypothetical protein